MTIKGLLPLGINCKTDRSHGFGNGHATGASSGNGRCFGNMTAYGSGPDTASGYGGHSSGYGDGKEDGTGSGRGSDKWMKCLSKIELLMRNIKD